MLAHRLHGQMDLRLQEEPEPDLRPGDVRLNVAYSGICGSDVHSYYADDDALPRLGHEGEGAVKGRPFYVGHETVGTVSEIADDVTAVEVGDRVAVFPLIACGECRQCVDEYPVNCERFDRGVSTVGFGAPIGGLAQSMVIPQSLAIKIPDGLSLLQGSLLEPLSVAATAVQRSAPSPDQVALVTGGGLVGVGVVLALKANGVKAIVLSETSVARRQNLVGVEGLTVCDPTMDDVAATVREQSAGAGADLVFECSGAPQAFDLAMKVAGKRSRIVLIALHHHVFPLSPSRAALNEVTVVGHNATTKRGFVSAADWLERGLLPVHDWVTTIDFARVVEDGLEPSRTGQLFKAVVEIAP
ncbi:alcohol dehydrogenase catalytic domain-containing protein [Paenarthrobacter nitroguajacolicus]|uniref:alcohol dehydrogenase catalytic domain-containing protein n=1 Tax=Paenarthrobacter nitroguajacolicus TaxID=211146 RepID=UPI00285C8B38|nr:alcohol dehydrogenase catalytic domain-containing protein [Paenarthrobacter nitroguajacolicus]MDR6639456.1 (R,R)-butanediol dehydrogenase/meso-butanediol dehydrogenase/diacetyl reductase [Paenarthrobacter nitroguajacolicus]